MSISKKIVLAAVLVIALTLGALAKSMQVNASLALLNEQKERLATRLSHFAHPGSRLEEVEAALDSSKTPYTLLPVRDGGFPTLLVRDPEAVRICGWTTPCFLVNWTAYIEFHRNGEYVRTRFERERQPQ